MSFTAPLKNLVKIAGLTVMAAAAFSSGSAWALTLTMPGPNTTSNETLNVGHLPSSTTPALTRTVSAGSYIVNDGTSSFSVFCLDPLTWFSTGTPGNPTVYTVVGLSNYLTAPIGSDGYAKQFNTVPYTDANISPYYKAQATPGGAGSTSVLNKLLELYSHAYASTVNNAVNAAAFQYAIWEIEGETAGSYSRTSGGLTMTAASTSVQTKADNYLAALNGTSTWASLNLSSTSDYNYTVYQATPTGSTQTFLRVTSSTTGNQTNTPVPEPGTGLLAAMAGLVWVGSRRRQAQAGKVV